MASTIVAGNITNGGTAISSDSTGILDIKTGTGSGTTALTIDASQNVTAANNLAASGFTSASTFGFKNRIINGAMQIDQRNNGASLTSTAAPIYSLDRWAINAAQGSKFTVQQNAGSVTPPVGFTNYLGITSSSAYNVQTSDYFLIFQAIEGLNCADLGFGTANAATVTLSFWVRSSLTGTFGASLRNSAGSRSYPFSFTINSANTYEQKSITIPGDTTGTWLTTNGVGIYVSFSLGAGATFTGTANSWQAGNFIQPTGAVSVVGTSGATFYITGVQLEKGSTATSFDFRDYGRELILCQRYYEVIDVLYFTSVWASVAVAAYWKVTKRADPTLVNTPGAGSGGAYSSFQTLVSGLFLSAANSVAAGGIVRGSSEL